MRISGGVRMRIGNVRAPTPPIPHARTTTKEGLVEKRFRILKSDSAKAATVNVASVRRTAFPSRFTTSDCDLSGPLMRAGMAGGLDGRPDYDGHG